jgi:hypothetical protein
MTVVRTKSLEELLVSIMNTMNSRTESFSRDQVRANISKRNLRFDIREVIPKRAQNQFESMLGGDIRRMTLSLNAAWHGQ